MRLVSSRVIATVAALVGAAVAVVYWVSGPPSDSNAAQAATKAVMYKPLQCGCCDEYAKYLERHGLEVEVNALRSLSDIRRSAGVPEGFEGCHTLLVEGYVVDGLVPIDTLRRLLSERPSVTGITLPGMPWGAPGMEQRPKAGPLVIYAFGDPPGAPSVYARE